MFYFIDHAGKLDFTISKNLSNLKRSMIISATVFFSKIKPQ